MLVAFIINDFSAFDFTFARIITGRFIAYGEAGDCYSMTQCPQGSFSINLAGTLLKVSDRTTWRGHGNKAVYWINKLDVSHWYLFSDSSFYWRDIDSFLGESRRFNVIFVVFNFFIRDKLPMSLVVASALEENRNNQGISTHLANFLLSIS